MNTQIINIVDSNLSVINDESVDYEFFLKYKVRWDIISHVIRWQLARRRSGNHSTKGISEIKCTTKKPYRQKGTGRARQGSLCSPQFRGGAVIFGPMVRSHCFSVNKKVKKLALGSVLSYKIASKTFSICDLKGFISSKTSDLDKLLAKNTIFPLSKKEKILVIGDDISVNFINAARNLKYMNFLPVMGANIYDILRHKYVLCTRSGFDLLKGKVN